MIDIWKAEEKTPFAGWDFSHLDGRMVEEQPPWSYINRSKQLMAFASSVLDIGTGGGERLLEMREAWPDKIAVTEGYAPNVKLASERLEPLGATVVDTEIAENRPMPFGNSEFELVLNRHSALNVDEIARILVPGGTLLTQQVHGMWAYDLLAVFDVKPQWPEATPERYVPWLRAAGLEIVAAQDWSGKLTFNDVGAIVYYLKAVPWLVPGFSVDTHLDALKTLQKQLDKQTQLVYEAKKYIIEASKPK